jgi:hypothetical protein
MFVLGTENSAVLLKNSTRAVGLARSVCCSNASRVTFFPLDADPRPPSETAKIFASSDDPMFHFRGCNDSDSSVLCFFGNFELLIVVSER